MRRHNKPMTQPNWKEKYGQAEDKTSGKTGDDRRAYMLNFISKEIIEKLSKEIVDSAIQFDGAEGGWTIQFQKEIQQQLKKNWL